MTAQNINSPQTTSTPTPPESKLLLNAQKILACLSQNGKKMSQPQIVEKTGIRQPQVSLALNYLIANQKVISTASKEESSIGKKIKRKYYKVPEELPASSTMVK